MPFFPGWTYDDQAIAASCERMANAGLLVASAGAVPSFHGEWNRRISAGETAFLACTVEPDKPPAFLQSIGDCVAMIYRSLQDCFNWDRKKNGAISRPVRLCFETIYGGSRVAIGRGQLGYSDGSIGAWAAEYIARYGVLERGVYHGTDLSKPREDLAQAWGQPRGGVPQVIEVLSHDHRFRAHKCESTDELADGLASGCFGGICRSRYCHYVDNEDFALFDQSGGHHTCIRGAFIDRRSNQRVFVEQQTHGSGVPCAHPVAHTTDGDVDLSDGAYLVRENDIARFLSSGEVWIYQPILGGEYR
jgi:hypothetical protein